VAIGIEIGPVRSGKEALDCVRMYIRQNDTGLVEVSEGTALNNLLGAHRSGAFLRVARDQDGLAAWLLADSGRPSWGDYRVIKQQFYACDRTGYRAFICLRELHASMVEEGRRIGARYAYASNSWYDDKLQYARMLELLGWSRRGHFATLRIQGATGGAGGGGLRGWHRRGDRGPGHPYPIGGVPEAPAARGE
jgi:hypothetical protein